ncbi:MAG: hypothetical protein JSR57_05140 [Verrucomicrobia bacterium]|nr:hypothetical protein [Verrucomicrobiota bacterium]
MATAALHPTTFQTGTTSVGTSNASPSSQTQPRNFLHRCVQELDPEIAANHEWDAYMSDLTAKATLVATAALFVVANVAALAGISFIAVVNPPLALCALPLVPLVTLASYYLFETGIDYYSTYSDNSAKDQQKAEKLRAIAQEYQSLPEDAAMTGIKLATMRIQWNTIPGVQQPADLNQFRPLIARYDYWTKQQEHFDREANTFTRRASDLVNPTANTITQTITTPSQRANIAAFHRLRSIKIQENALASKAYAALVHAIILRPEYTGDGFEGIAKVKFTHGSEIEVMERLLAQQFNDPGANHFIEFHNQNIQPLTFAEIRDNPIHVIAQRFVQAIAASAA